MEMKYHQTKLKTTATHDCRAVTSILIAFIICITFSTNCWFLQKLALSEEEGSYLTFLRHELSLPIIPSDKAPHNEQESLEDLARSLRRTANSLIAISRTRLEVMQSRRPPELFANMYKIVCNRWNALIKYEENFRDLLVTNFETPMLQLVQRWQEGLISRDETLAQLNTELDNCLTSFEPMRQRSAALDATFNNFMQAEYARINKIVRARASPRQPQRSLPALTAKIRYQPYFIPVSISIDSKGKVELSSGVSVPTPIGVFSLEANLEFKREKMLIVYYKKSKTAFKLDSRPFVFKVNYDGVVLIEYASNGVMHVHLDD